MKFIAISTLMLAAVTVSAGCKTAPQTVLNSWAIQTQQDLQAAHAIMLESHPGPKDAENPGFMRQANISFKHAMKLSVTVTDQAGYGAVLRAYSAGFRDGHFAVYSKVENEGGADYYWPGILPTWRANKVKIAYTLPKQNDLLEAELLSCDGIPARKLVLDRVFQFDSGKPDQVSYWARKTHRLYLDTNNPFIPRLNTCTFLLSNGETAERRLIWEKAGDAVFQKYRWATMFGTRPSTGMREIRSGEFWINLPDFSPNEVGTKDIRALFSEIFERRDELRSAKSIVIDMRGNQGGASIWGDEMIKALWGGEYQHSRDIDLGVYIEHRLSEGNVAHRAWIVDYLIENSYDESLVKFFQTVFEGAKLAFSEGREFYREPDDEDGLGTHYQSEHNHVPNPVKASVHFLTDGNCASACLDFADAIFELEGVTHIGYPTSSDTTYMEIRSEDLPSGLGEIAIPTKVWRNRARASGAFYTPKYQYDGLDWSDAAILAWAKTVM